MYHFFMKSHEKNSVGEQFGNFKMAQASQNVNADLDNRRGHFFPWPHHVKIDILRREANSGKFVFANRETKKRH